MTDDDVIVSRIRMLGYVCGMAYAAVLALDRELIRLRQEMTPEQVDEVAGYLGRVGEAGTELLVRDLQMTARREDREAARN